MDNKPREIPAIFPAFGYALSSPGEGRRRRAWDGPPPHNASIEGPDSPLQKGGKHWGPPRKFWLWNLGESLWCGGEHYPRGVCAPEGILRERVVVWGMLWERACLFHCTSQ